MSLARRAWWTLVGIVAVAMAMAGLAAWFAARSLLLAEADTSLQRRVERLLRAPENALRAARAGDSWRGGAMFVRLSMAIALPADAPPWPAGLPTALAEDGDIVAARAADRQYRLLQASLAAPDGGAGRLLVAFDVSSLYVDLVHLAWLLVGTSGLALSLAAIAAGRLRDQLLAPLRELGEGIDRLPSTDLEARLGALALPPELEHIRLRIDELLARLAAVRARERRTVADIAHELRTPLATMRSEIGFARERGDHSALLEGLAEQAAHLQQRSDGLLLLSRLDAGERLRNRVPVAVAEAIGDAWAHWSARAQAKGCRLELSDPADTELPADPPLFGILLANLLGNAVAHGEPGIISVDIAHEADGCTLRCANPVAGLEPGPRPAACEPFWRQDPARSGGEHSGLGLAVAKGIVGAHGGTIMVQVAAPGSFVVSVRWPLGSADD